MTMSEIKIDPRIKRTRKLIMDSFIELAMKKDVKDITIKDITAEATVNRATFYSHFTDKYDLLEKSLTEDLMMNVSNEIAQHEKLTEETIVSIFLSITTFHLSLSSQCRRSFEAFSVTIEAIIKKKLEALFYQALLKQHAADSDESLRIAAFMLSWGIYGASVDWKQNSSIAPEEYIRLALPYFMYGMDFYVTAE